MVMLLVIAKKRTQRLCACVLVVCLVVALVSVILRPSSSPAQAVSFPLQVTCASAHNHHLGALCVHTVPGASLSVQVQYCSGGYATSSSLRGDVLADANGNWTWGWSVDTSCLGTASAFVDSSFGGYIEHLEYGFVVV